MEDILKNAGKSPAKVWQQFFWAKPQKCKATTADRKSADRKSAEKGQQKSRKNPAKDVGKNGLVKISLATGYKKNYGTFAGHFP